MAQWRNLEKLRKSNAHQVLEGLCSINRNAGVLYKIRTLCPDFVEDTNLCNCEDDVTAQCWMVQLLSCLGKLESEGDLAYQLEIQNMTTFVKEQYGDCANALVADMRRCLEMEKELIQAVQQQDDRRQPVPDGLTTETIKSELEKIGKAQRDLARKAAELVTHQETVNLEIHDNWLDKALMLEQDVDCTMQIDQNQDLFVLKQEITSQLEEMVVQMVSLFPQIWACVDEWTRTLHLHLNDLAELPPRDDLSEICWAAGKLIIDAINLTQQMHQLFGVNEGDMAQRVTEKEEELRQMLKKHINRVCIVTRPPPSILQVGSGESKQSFLMGLCLLGASSLGQLTSSKVSAGLFHKKDLKKVLAGQQVAGMCHVTTNRNNKLPVKLSATNNGDLVANFAEVSLDKVHLNGRGRGVAHLLYFMVFHIELSVLEQSIDIQVSAPPMALVSHLGYDCNVRGRLVWNAAFPEQNGTPFEDKEQVPWQEVASMLSHIFRAKAGKHLNQQQLEYLGHVAFKKRGMRCDISKRLISRNQVIENDLHKPARDEKADTSLQFSFWKWFYSCLNLITGPLKKEWLGGLIDGFLSKKLAMEMLKDKPDGAFLLRFCEKSIERSTSAAICGCLAVAVITTNETREVFHSKDNLALSDIQKMNLTEILSRSEVVNRCGQNRQLCHYLQPNTPFNEAFEAYLPRHVVTDDVTDDGYKKATFTIGDSKSKLSVGTAQTPTSDRRPYLAVIAPDPVTGKETVTLIKADLTSQDIESVRDALEAASLNRGRLSPPNSQKRPLVDVTNTKLQENQSNEERSMKYGRTGVYTDTNTQSSCTDNPDLASADYNLLSWELPPPLDSGQE